MHTLCTGGASFYWRPLSVDDPTRRRPDIAMANRVLGWHPVVDVAAGIEQTARWFRILQRELQPVD